MTSHTAHSPSTFHRNLPRLRTRSAALKHCCYASAHNTQCERVHVFYLEALAAFRYYTLVVTPYECITTTFFFHPLPSHQSWTYPCVWFVYKIVLFYWPLLQEFWWKTTEKNSNTISKWSGGKVISEIYVVQFRTHTIMSLNIRTEQNSVMYIYTHTVDEAN